MKKTNLKIPLLLLASIIFGAYTITEISRSGGITDCTKMENNLKIGCYCHDSWEFKQEAAKNRKVNVTIIPNDGKRPVMHIGEEKLFRIRVKNNNANETNRKAGVNIAVEPLHGTLLPNDPTLQNGPQDMTELSHTAPKLPGADDTVSFTFKYRAPPTQNLYRIWGTGNSVNGNDKADKEDHWNWVNDPAGHINVFVYGDHVIDSLKISAQAQVTPRNQENCIFAILVGANGPVPNIAVNFQTRGANTDSTTISADSSGLVEYCYTGKNLGYDTISASTFHNGQYHYKKVIILWVEPPTTVQLRMILQGFYRPMENQLNSDDTIRTFLRSTVSPYDIVDSTIGILDSCVLGFTSNFPNGLDGNFYLQIRHRNSIETWSKPEIFSSDSVSYYDFTTDSTRAFGNNMIRVDTSGFNWAIYSGDVNQDGIIDAEDVSDILNAVRSSLSGYIPEDITGDLFCDAEDLSIVVNNKNSAIQVHRP